MFLNVFDLSVIFLFLADYYLSLFMKSKEGSSYSNFIRKLFLSKMSDWLFIILVSNFYVSFTNILAPYGLAFIAHFNLFSLLLLFNFFFYFCIFPTMIFSIADNVIFILYH